MFENYLRNPQAIAALASSIEGFSEDDNATTLEQIQTWFDTNGWTKKYVTITGERTLERWRQEGYGARILAGLFSELSGHRVEYLKVEYGVWFTDWMIANSPEDLRELGMFLSDLLPTP